MMNLLLRLLRYPVVRRIAVYLCAVPILAAAVFGVYSHLRGPVIHVVEKPGNVTEITIDRPVLITREVVKYVEDKTGAQKLLADNAALKNQITVLSETIADLRTTGSGKVVYIDQPVPGETRVVQEGQFRDWRLYFTFQGEQAKYELTQRFEALVAAGRDVAGKPTATVKLFELGPGDTRTPLTTTKTTLVVASGQSTRWFLFPSVQAGAAVSDTTPGVVIGVQWLKRGTTKAAEDSTYSLLTPVVFLSSGRREFGLLPVSFNLGRIPRNPLNDVWLSPYISGSGRFGLTLTATF
jgi:hypothetical protein